jgi:hypothetical protein
MVPFFILVWASVLTHPSSLTECVWLNIRQMGYAKLRKWDGMESLEATVWERESQSEWVSVCVSVWPRVLHRILNTQLILAVTGFACGSFRGTKGGLRDGRGCLPPHPLPLTYWSKDRTLNNHTTVNGKRLLSELIIKCMSLSPTNLIWG